MNVAPKPRMLRGKVIMVGAPGVGKSSLVRQFVHRAFSDEYHSTLGVKVDRKTVTVDGWSVAMLLWDMHGEAEGLTVPKTYLRGAAGALVVLDASRPDTARSATELCERVREASPNVEVVCLLNKSDLVTDMDAAKEAAQAVTEAGAAGPVLTSAKTGENVDLAFDYLAQRLIAKTNG